MAYPTILVELWLNGAWLDITNDVYKRGGLTITRGRGAEAQRVTHGRCRLTIRNLDGRYTPRNPNSPYYGQLGRNTPLRVSATTLDGTLTVRFVGEVSAWPQRWHPSGQDAWVTVEASGILRRLRQGSPPPQDAMRRHVDTVPVRPLSYWPLTDGKDARAATEVAAGGQPIRALGPNNSFFQGQPEWGSGTLAPWLNQVAELTQRKADGTLTARVNLADTPGWSFDHVRSGSGLVEGLFLRDSGEGTNVDPQVEWQVDFDATTAVNAITLYHRVITDAGSAISVAGSAADPGIFDDNPHHVRFTVADDGASGTDWTLFVDGVLAASGNRAGIATRPLSTVTYQWAAEDTDATGTTPVSLGHLVYWGTSPPSANASYRALLGHQRERAGRRIERLCAEENVPLHIHGNADETPEMGPQRPGTLMDLVEASEDVDGGILGEARDDLALSYRTRFSMYNQGVS